MSSQEVLWIAGGIGALFCAIFMAKSSQKEPSRLKMIGGEPAPSDSKAVAPAAKSVGRPKARTGATRERVSDSTVDAVASEARIRSVNVIFNYNGHSWDAYEVLGCPAGAPLPMVKQAFDQALRSTDPASHEFLRAAYQAITKLKSV